MALTDLQRARVRSYTGHGQGGYDLDSRLESRLDTLSAAEETLVRELLVRLAACEDREDSALSSGAGEFKRVEDVVFRDGSPFAGLAELGTSLIGRLARLLGVEVWGDYFGSGGCVGQPIPLG